MFLKHMALHHRSSNRQDVSDPRHDQPSTFKDKTTLDQRDFNIISRDRTLDSFRRSNNARLGSLSALVSRTKIVAQRHQIRFDGTIRGHCGWGGMSGRTHIFADWRRLMTEKTAPGGKLPRRVSAFIVLAFPFSIASLCPPLVCHFRVDLGWKRGHIFATPLTGSFTFEL